MHCNKEERKRASMLEKKREIWQKGGKELWQRGERACTPRCTIIERKEKKSFNARERKKGRFSRREKKEGVMAKERERASIEGRKNAHPWMRYNREEKVKTSMLGGEREKERKRESFNKGE
jgi:hypothetical protein